MGMDMPPAQIFTYKGQHPPMSCTVVLSLNRNSLAKELREAHEHEPETADAFQADRNFKALEFLRSPDLFRLQRKKSGHSCLGREHVSVIEEDVQTVGRC